jgi:hypothetical protein
MPAIEGGCLCAAVRYRISTAPLSSSVCHCRTCRLAGGAAAVAWFEFERRGFEWLSGVVRSFRSSPSVVRTFCERCGTALTYANEGAPERMEVTTATLDEPGRYPPTREVWLSHRIGWQPLNPALTHYPEGSGL